MVPFGIIGGLLMFAIRNRTLGNVTGAAQSPPKSG